jgi:hypothetical protein
LALPGDNSVDATLIPKKEKRDRMAASWLAAIPDGAKRDEARRYLSAFTAPESQNNYANSGIENQRVEIACTGDGAPYTAKGIIRNFAGFSFYSSTLLERLLDKNACPGTKNLDSNTIAWLESTIEFNRRLDESMTGTSASTTRRAK